MEVKEFCNALDTWARLMVAAKAERKVDGAEEFAASWQEIRLAITKSCLLKRMLYMGLQPSQTLCPVHKGMWSGLHHGWPGQTWSDGQPVKESSQCRAWYDAGCRCWQHCGCTTGWQPDEHSHAKAQP